MSDQVTIYPVTTFVSLRHAARELRPLVHRVQPLISGRGFENFGDMRPREALGNLLVCLAANGGEEGPFGFSSDPIGGDGIIINRVTQETYPTEHVMVLCRAGQPRPADPAEDLILNGITRKNDRGRDYAAGKMLVVFVEGLQSEFHPNRLARRLPDPFHFSDLWLVALQEPVTDGSYRYGVARLSDGPNRPAPIYSVHIAPSFEEWTVTQTQ